MISLFHLICIKIKESKVKVKNTFALPSETIDKCFFLKYHFSPSDRLTVH